MSTLTSRRHLLPLELKFWLAPRDSSNEADSTESSFTRPESVPLTLEGLLAGTNPRRGIPVWTTGSRVPAEWMVRDSDGYHFERNGRIPRTRDELARLHPDLTPDELDTLEPIEQWEASNSDAISELEEATASTPSRSIWEPTPVVEGYKHTVRKQEGILRLPNPAESSHPGSPEVFRSTSGASRSTLGSVPRALANASRASLGSTDERPGTARSTLETAAKGFETMLRTLSRGTTDLTRRFRSGSMSTSTSDAVGSSFSDLGGLLETADQESDSSSGESHDTIIPSSPIRHNTPVPSVIGGDSDRSSGQGDDWGSGSFYIHE